ncbi:MAG TPA: LCP family protein [Acidimicrobiales bacterium]|nr:LCP family protein [Acidimicrobiales bacterium]
MSEELKIAFEQMAARGNPSGAPMVVANALAEARVVRSPSARRYSFAAVAALVTTVTAVVAGIVVVRSHVPHVDHVEVGSALANGDDVAGAMTVLVVGSDSRSGLDDPMRRADAIMLLRLERATGRVSVLSLPRDLYVPIAGSESPDRIAVASTVSRTALIETVKAVTGIAIDHYLEFDFAGFTKVVDAAGGVDLYIPATMRDELTGLHLPAGCSHLDGATALAYVQSRHVQYQDGAGGRFTPEPTGDLGRISRQQLLFLVALDQLTRTRDLARIDRVAQAVADNVRVDEHFSFRDAIEFAKNWVHTDGRLSLLVYPATAKSLENGAVVLEPDRAQAPSVVDGFSNPPLGEVTDQRDAPTGASCR